MEESIPATGFTLENEPRNVCPTRSDSSIKYHANPRRGRTVVSTSHYWVVAFKGMSSLSEIKGAAPFGVFDQYSFLNATTLTGCPMTRPRNRLLNKDGKYVRYFEKDVRESMEILSRSFFHFSLFSFCFTTCYQHFFKKKNANQKYIKKNKNKNTNTHTHTHTHTHTGVLTDKALFSTSAVAQHRSRWPAS